MRTAAVLTTQLLGREIVCSVGMAEKLKPTNTTHWNPVAVSALFVRAKRYTVDIFRIN